MKAYDRCENCGCEFADHNYVEGSVFDYTCPHPQQESVYGFFAGGDPRDFSPDYESCDPKEISRWKAACKLWDEAESRGETPTPEKCPSGWERDEATGAVMHVLRAPYGIGIVTWKIETFWEAP